MSIGRTRSVALLGLSGSIVEVEADLSSQLPALTIIGLPDTALAEARDRVRSAAKNAGCPLPARRLTVNLSPASLPKQGSAFDLAIALSCLAAAGEVDPASVEAVVHLGELGLDGRVRAVGGVLPAVLAAVRAGFGTVMVPGSCIDEARLVPGARVIGVSSLREATIHHGGDFGPLPAPAPEAAPAGIAAAEETVGGQELAEIAGNEEAIEALLTAAAGGHHVSLTGPPGAGKTMLASRLPAILPDLDLDAALEVSSLRSLSGHPVGRTLAIRPPFESPHHTASAAAMIGGGSGVIRPGAAARASHGVLFLDEAPEFPARVLDVLRQPLESGVITIHRANAVARFPGSFQLVLASNPCPCGLHGAPDSSCACPPMARRRYAARLSGPLLDRVDIRLWVNRLTLAQLAAAAERPGLTTRVARERVAAARSTAAARLAGTPWTRNAQVPGPWLRGAGGLHPGGRATAALDRALDRGNLTMRGYDRVLKIAWTIADLEGSDRPSSEHIGRALGLRKGYPV